MYSFFKKKKVSFSMRQITPDIGLVFDIEILGILNYSIIVKPTLTVFLRPVC